MPVLGLDFPPVGQLTDWPALFGHGIFAVNKVVLLEWLAAVIVFAFFWTAARGRSLVPSGVQNAGEAVIEFVQNAIILQTMGPEGMSWTPFLLTLFAFIFVCDIFEVIPLIQMPVNARMALPAFMALIVWIIYNSIGLREQGFVGYMRSTLGLDLGVPLGILVILLPIEFVSNILIRPFSLAVRLFANMLAGHLILATFAVLTAALFSATYIGAVLPGSLLAILFGFEVFVSSVTRIAFSRPSRRGTGSASAAVACFSPGSWPSSLRRAGAANRTKVT